MELNTFKKNIIGINLVDVLEVLRSGMQVRRLMFLDSVALQAMMPHGSRGEKGKGISRDQSKD